MRASPFPEAPPFMVVSWRLGARKSAPSRPSGAYVFPLPPPPPQSKDHCLALAARTRIVVAPDLPRPEPPGAFVPVDSALRTAPTPTPPPPRNQLGSCQERRLGALSPILLQSPSTANELPRTPKQHCYTPTLPPPTRSLRLDPSGRNPTVRFLQSDAAGGSSSPWKLRLCKAPLKGGPNLSITNSVRIHGGSTVQQIPLHSNPGRSRPQTPSLHPPRVPAQLSPQPGTRRFKSFLPSLLPPFLQQLRALPRSLLTAASRQTRVFDGSHLRLL